MQNFVLVLYIQKFNIVFKHKFGKQHIVPDVLFRFPMKSTKNQLKTNKELNVLFTASLIEMNNAFYDKIIKNYKFDFIWKNLIVKIETIAEDGTQIFSLPKNDFIYRLKNYTSSDHGLIFKKLCIFKSSKCIEYSPRC